MSTSGIETFAHALTRSAPRPAAPSGGGPASTLAVLGAGTDGQMYAALGLAAGAEVRLFSAYGAELATLRQVGAITLRGEGPVGSFHVDQPKGPSIRTTAALDEALAAVSALIPNGVAMASCVHSGFDDASAAVELPALMIGGPAAPGGGPVVPEGGVPLAENATFRALIGLAHEGLIARLWAERRAVAQDFGVRDLPDAAGAIGRVAGAERGPGSRPVPTESEARELLRSGVVGSLIPLVSAAARTGRAVPATEAMIELAMALLGRDLRGAGRRLETIGITATEAGEARRQFAQILNGGLHG